MHLFFERFGKTVLFAITIVLVLGFQSYWLWNNFQNHKTEILEQTTVQMQKVLMDDLFFKKAFRRDTTMDDGMKAKVTEKVSEIINFNNIKNFDGEISIVSAGDKMVYNSKNPETVPKLDSMLYFTMKPFMQKNYSNPDFTVYFETKKTKKTYPNHRIIKKENTTSPVSSLSQPTDTFKIHIENLSYTVTTKMYDDILFSLLYLILFLGTVSLLLNNVKINRRLLENKEIFTRNVTHELKIPISTIMIAAEGFEKYNIIEEPEAAKKYINTIKRAGNQLSFFVESILLHAKAESGHTKASENPINLLNLLEEVKSILSEIISEKRASIMFHDISEHVVIRGDYDQMRQIFLNLFDNSIKYSTRNPEIIVSCKNMIDRTIVKIQDNGIGIPKKYAEEIFEPYFRAATGDIHDVKGFGLGLSFVRSALKNQNGKIRVLESTPKGTVMELNFAAYV